jgi:site-specific recombinase XerD
MLPDRVSLLVKNIAGCSGFEKPVGPHTLRRSCATELIKAGANPGHVKDILGHEDFSSLASYVKLAAEDLKDALRRFHPRENRQSL